MNEIDYVARVAKGVALLDEKRPGWERLIDLEALDIAEPARCVTAQLSGERDYRAGQLQLGLGEASYIAHGFNAEGACSCCAPPDLPEGYNQTDAYGKLSTLWRKVITGRLAAGSEASA